MAWLKAKFTPQCARRKCNDCPGAVFGCKCPCHR
jgi:hypothetical protein